ncbi:MAG: hypothetical protein AAAB16_11950 [Pseudomonas sp.]|uniref:hypothetical protein n=1 Tax=Pseudomonas sp. TaxID=306 RepID=UPI0030F201E2
MFLKTLLAIVLITLPAAVLFYAGIFSTSFSLNMCYSDVLTKLGARTESVAKAESPQALKDWAAFINNLPLRGYETDCAELLKLVEANAARAK